MRSLFQRLFGSDRAGGAGAAVVEKGPITELWRLASASETGAGHLRTSTPCQDAHAFQLVGREWLALALADGAGSAARSEVGSRVAVEAALRILATHLSEIASAPP